MAAALRPLGMPCSAALPSRRKFPLLPAAQTASTHRPCSRPARLCVAAGKRLSEADMYHGVHTPGPAAPQPSGPPLYVIAPLAFAGLIAALRVGKAVKKNMSGGGNRLEERGFKRGGMADDKAYTAAIKGMRKMQYEELSDEAILAARQRRQREVERDMAPMDLESIELPQNHPFAVRKNLRPEEEALQRSRMSARRGLSAEDMQLLREQQALADQMDAEGEERQAARRRQQGR